MFKRKFNPRKEYAVIIDQIESGQRMSPSHDIPRSIREPGQGFESFRTPAHDIFFEDFRWFQTIMNHHTTGPWCTEEMSERFRRERKVWAILNLAHLGLIPWDDAIGFVRAVRFQLGAFPDYDALGRRRRRPQLKR